MNFIPYFYFPGNAVEAIGFYKETFKGEVTGIMKYGDQVGTEVAEEMKDKVLHAELIVKGNSIYVSDHFQPSSIVAGNQIEININCDSEEELRRIFVELSSGGTVKYPLMDTFWGAIHGMLKDKFGIGWSLNYQKPQA